MFGAIILFCALYVLYDLTTTEEQKKKLREHLKKAWNEEPKP